MLKTYIILIMLGIIILLTNCNAKKKSSNLDEFEGVITYHEVQESRNGEFDVEDTLRLYYSHGNYVGIHSERSSKFHIIKDFYFQKDALRLFLNNTSDSLYALPLFFPIERLDSFKIRKADEQILSRKCEKIEIRTSYVEGNSTTYTDGSFIISRGFLNVNKSHFKNWKLGAFDKVIDTAGCFYLKSKSVHYDSSHRNIISSKILEVISVEVRPIDPKIFEIDRSKIVTLKN